MDATTATDFITTNKTYPIIIRTTDGMAHLGDALSVNSKGVNIKDSNGKTRSFALSRIDGMDLDQADGMDDDDAATDLTDALNDAATELSDGASTTEVAAVLSNIIDREITPKELRVHLRALGLGVGKGNKYALSTGELRAVHGLITSPADAPA